MRPFGTLKSRACPLPYANIDTDQLIPARYLRLPRSEGYGPFLLHDLRRRAGGELDPDFTFNDAAYAGAEIAVARRNFGCGSSREAAVYALADYGFRAIAAPSFGDIFAQNAVKNGLLPARIEEADADRLLAALIGGSVGPLEVDLSSQTIRFGGGEIGFAIDPVWKQQLLNGWDDIDFTRNEVEAITAWFARDETLRPWARPRRSA